MAAAIKAINAKIRSNKVTDYLCSTHFWGPASNFGIPLAAVMDTQKDAELISGPMTGALILYAATFMRYALAVTPKNYLLFACHLTNFGAQTTQGYRYLAYWKYTLWFVFLGFGADSVCYSWGGREAQLAEKAKQGAQAAEAGA
ncbi:Mitochondrial pyruvate carrier 1 [Penicillium chermesinum]|uniref:Mitochondrial pyruvate carrier n=1 Tax=Penicillium chermesinum TaxID=63820 RepID=A0A9W9TJW0_9EURO|nr:Mitochondrial pyruvate carrier 1 [Penicillium chermesinum]KAJ5225408.1 Mitochondrial pyruvate carrier 1 [Penicillium chermesinum]